MTLTVYYIEVHDDFTTRRKRVLCFITNHLNNYNIITFNNYGKYYGLLITINY